MALPRDHLSVEHAVKGRSQELSAGEEGDAHSEDFDETHMTACHMASNHVPLQWPTW